MSCENCATLEARIAKLEAENAELRAALADKNAGINALLAEYQPPILDALGVINHLMGITIGIAMAGPQNVAKAQIKAISMHLAAWLKALELETGRGVRAGLEFQTTAPVGADAIQDILTDWYTDPQPQALRDVIGQHSQVYASLMDYRQLGPGKKKLSQGGAGDEVIDRLCADAHELLKGGMTWPQIYDALMTMYSDRRSSERAYLVSAEDATDNLKKAYRRRYKK